MPLTPHDVSTKVFGPTRFRRGYDEAEVDGFLDQVEAELTRLTNDNASLLAQLDQARHELPGTAPFAAPAVPEPVAEPAPAAAQVPSQEIVVPDTTENDMERISRTLVLAQRTADQALREAREEADEARTSARADADAIVAKAKREADDRVGAAELIKAHLESEVDSLRTFEREYRTRLRAYLQMQLKGLEAEPQDEPSAVTQHPTVSLPGQDDGSSVAAASVRLPTDIGSVPSSLFQPPTLVGANAGAPGHPAHGGHATGQNGHQEPSGPAEHPQGE